MTGSEAYVPDSTDLSVLADAARGCRGCGLYRDADQTVFGAGLRSARMMLIGEQPGDQEDRAGVPFVGPAGKLLDRALDAAGIGRELTYVTNAVKHFKFTRPERGTRRLHQKPSRSEVVACRPWLIAEMRAVEPEVVVCLGATAAQSLLGPSFRVTRQRGVVLDLDPDDSGGVAPKMVATIHPSAVLRGPPEARDDAFAGLVADLKVALDACGG